MKTSTWINLVGILCIIFGAHGILTSIMSLVAPEMTGMVKEKMQEISPELLRLVSKLPIIVLITNIIYLMAGIFFLIKRSFSLKLMYTALILSILTRIIPLLFFNQFGTNSIMEYEISIFSLLGPFIDVVLLLIVFRLAKYFFKPENEPLELLGENIRGVLTPGLLRILTFTGLLCFAVPFFLFGLWVYVAGTEGSHPGAVAVYYSHLPDFLAGGYKTSYISLAFSFLAIILSSISLKLPGKLWKLNMIVLILSSALLLLNLFQMM